MSPPPFLESLQRDGFVVVPGVISPDTCAHFVESAWKWLEAFPNGFRRDDRTTWTKEHLPSGNEMGLYNRYAVNHEDFVWKVRCEPGIVRVFEQVWGTDDLIASFDGMNVSLPVNDKHGRTDIEVTHPWPHIDQDARHISRLELYQGIANLSPSGPDDGGLVVLRGSHLLHEAHFASIGGFRSSGDAGVGRNGYSFSSSDADWYRANGCEQVKVCAGPGDLILWDSRTVHWNCSPTGDRPRFATYVCYCPREWMSEQDLRTKYDLFDRRKGTTHWPHQNVVPEDADTHDARPRRPDDSLDPADRDRPFSEPHASPAVMRLVGARA